MSQEVDWVKCKQCHELKMRIRHSRNVSGRMRFVGEDGKLWNGSKCGSCHCVEVRVKKFNKESSPTDESI